MLRLLSLLLAHSACAIVVVTHASGRMGVSVVGQLREQLLLNPERERPPWCEASEDSLQIRAVVRSEQEAARLQLDLCGSVLRGGVLTPLLDMEKDLGIQICVCADDADEVASLERCRNEAYRWELKLASEVLASTLGSWMAKPRINRRLLHK